VAPAERGGRPRHGVELDLRPGLLAVAAVLVLEAVVEAVPDERVGEPALSGVAGRRRAAACVVEDALRPHARVVGASRGHDREHARAVHEEVGLVVVDDVGKDAGQQADRVVHHDADGLEGTVGRARAPAVRLPHGDADGAHEPGQVDDGPARRHVRHQRAHARVGHGDVVEDTQQRILSNQAQCVAFAEDPRGHQQRVARRVVGEGRADLRLARTQDAHDRLPLARRERPLDEPRRALLRVLAVARPIPATERAAHQVGEEQVCLPPLLAGDQAEGHGCPGTALSHEVLLETPARQRPASR
jgi:hypothetical protein